MYNNIVYDSNNIAKMLFSQKNSKNVQINGTMYLLHDFALQKASIFSFMLEPSVSQEPIDIKIPLASESVLGKIFEIMYVKCDYGKSIIADEKITLEYMVSILTPMMHMSLEKSIIEDCVMKMLQIIKTNIMSNEKKIYNNPKLYSDSDETSDDSEECRYNLNLQKSYNISILIDLVKMKICQNLLLIVTDCIGLRNVDVMNIKLINTELKLAGYTQSSKSYIIMKMFQREKKYEQVVTDSINFFVTQGKNMENLSDNDIDTIDVYINNKIKEKDTLQLYLDSVLTYEKFVKMIIPKLRVRNPNVCDTDLMKMVDPLWMKYKKSHEIVNDLVPVGAGWKRI